MSNNNQSKYKTGLDKCFVWMEKTLGKKEIFKLPSDSNKLVTLIKQFERAVVLYMKMYYLEHDILFNFGYEPITRYNKNRVIEYPKLTDKLIQDFYFNAIGYYKEKTQLLGSISNSNIQSNAIMTDGINRIGLAVYKERQEIIKYILKNINKPRRANNNNG
jgi:hypothetical protein